MDTKTNWLDRLKLKYAEDRFFYEVFTQEVYKRARDIGQVDTVLDVGALAGEFSFYIYAHAKHIYAIEAEPKRYKELERNVKRFNLSKIKPFHLGISDTNDNVHVRVRMDRGAHFIVKDKAEDSVEIKCRTLNTFLGENNIKSVDILKIDIENGEDKVFSSPDIDKALKKVKFIIGEHGNLDLLTAHGFEIEKTNTGWIAKK